MLIIILTFQSLWEKMLSTNKVTSIKDFTEKGREKFPPESYYQRLGFYTLLQVVGGEEYLEKALWLQPVM